MDIGNYEEYYTKYLNLIKKHDYGTLSTSVNTYVTSRTMYFEIDEEYIYLLTHASYFKNEQILNNPNVSFTIYNVNIEGQISDEDDTLSQENLYNKLLKTNYIRFSSEDELILYKIKPEIIKIWDKEHGNARRLFLYPRTKIATQQTKA